MAVVVGSAEQLTMAGCVGPCGRMTHLSGTLQTQARPLGEAALGVLIVRRALRRRTAKIVVELASRSSTRTQHTPRNHSALRTRSSRTRAKRLPRAPIRIWRETAKSKRARWGTPSRFDDGVALGYQVVLVNSIIQCQLENANLICRE